jgi:hypothetical protein
MAFEIEKVGPDELAEDIGAEEEQLFDDIELPDSEEDDEDQEAQEEEQGGEEQDVEGKEADSEGEQEKGNYQLPAYWSAEERAEFEALPEEAKSRFIALEQKREAFTTRKSQELSEKMRQAEALGPIAHLIQNDPNFRGYISQYGQQKMQAQSKDEEPLPEDPIEALQEQAVRRAKAEVLKELAPQLQQQQQQSQQQTMEMTIAQARSDPEFESVDVAMQERLMEIAQADFDRAQQIRQTLLSDPVAYQRAYAETKQHIAQTRRTASAKAPAATTRERKAPRLQGRGAPPESPKSPKQRYQSAKQRVDYGDFGSVGEMLSAAFGDI